MKPLAATVAAALVLGGAASALTFAGGAQGAYPGKNGVIAFVKGGQKVAYIWTIQADGTGLRRIVKGEAPAFSPDGTRLAFDVWGLGSVFVKPFDGGTAVNITDLSNQNAGATNCDESPTWSPDGATIAVSKVTGDDCGGASVELDLIKADGTSRRQTDDANDFPGVDGGDFEPAWGPGGGRIAVARQETSDKGFGNGPFDVWLLDAKSGAPALRITHDGDSHNPAFSPDGQQMLFVSGGTIELRRQSRKIVRLTSGTDPAWSPDGKQIVYATKLGLMLILPDGTHKHLLLRCTCRQPDWQPVR